jgi:hypothetical protein
VQDRLFKEASLRQNRINDLKEDIFKAKCPFKPITNTFTASGTHRKMPTANQQTDNFKADMSMISYRPTVVDMTLIENNANNQKKNTSLKPEAKRSMKRPPLKQKTKTADESQASFSFREYEATPSTTACGSSYLRPNDSRKTITSVGGSMSDMSYRVSNKENSKPRRKVARPTPLTLAKPKFSVEEADEYCPTFGNFKLMNIN